MAVRNPKIFGLNVLSYFSDIIDKNEALITLNLPPFDLNVIRGSADAGASRGDWISLSRLSYPLYETLDRFRTDSEQYERLLDLRAGTNRVLFGNLNINGSISGNAIRYRYLDGTGTGATIKIADISTSRVSAWSSSDSPVTEISPISYGAQVKIRSGGALQFGTQSNGATGPRLQTTIVPQRKEFASEFPTSKISCNIGGSTVVLYAMKGIPVVFTGFFRNLDATIRLTSLISNTPASWKIVETENSNNFVNFENRGTTTSSINFRSSVFKERYIQFYYNPDNISTITIKSANISFLPQVKFSNLTSLDFSFNQLQDFPNINSITPNIRILNLSNNYFYQSNIESERKLNSSIINKIPVGLRELYLGNTFYGSIQQNTIANRFPNLTVLHLGRDRGSYFHPDTADVNCELPNVSNTCETYNARDNDFRTFGTTDSANGRYNIKDLTNLITLDIGSNWNLTGSFSIASGNNKIEAIYSYSTGLPLPTGLAGKTSFTTLHHYHCRNAGPLVVGGNYLYDGCTSLKTLHLYDSRVTGPIPKFTNNALSYLDLRYTNITGGDPNGNTDYVIPERTFENCTDLVYMLIQSGNLLTNPIHPNIFSYTPNLYYFWYISYGRTIGPIPTSLSSCKNLTWLVLHYNNFSGTMPTLAANPNIYYVDVTYNSLTGAIPSFKNLSSLTYLYMYNNKFTSLSKFQNLANLTYFYAHNNQMTGEIPTFEDCPNLFYIVLFNNQFTDYQIGGFRVNYRLNYLDLSGNSLTQQAVNQIITDLYTNYNNAKRGGVTINLRGNSVPSGDALDYVEILRSKNWSIVLN